MNHNLGIFLSLIFSLSFTVSQSQVKFYSNPEPVLELNTPSAEDYLYLSADGNELVYTTKISKANKGGQSNPGDIWFGNIIARPQIDTLLTSGFNKRDIFYSPIGYDQDRTHFLFNETKFSQGLHSSRVMTYDMDTRIKSELSIPYLQNSAEYPTGFISRNGAYLILSMDNKTGYGVEDLYVCELEEDGSWSAPKNLGQVINTEKQEITPFLDSDNQTLYFATNARGGYGSFDIYYSKRLDDSWRNWTEPRNLGGFVNTEGSETSFSYNRNSEYAYFISTQNSDGYGDIKRVRIYPTNQSPQEEETTKALEADTINYEKMLVFIVKNKNTDVQMPFNYIGNIDRSGEQVNYESFKETVTEVSFGLNAGDAIDMEFKSKGFLSQSIRRSAAEITLPIDTIIVKLDSLETGRVITLEHVLFKQGTAEFLESSMRELELVLEMMNENQDVKIFLKGHTDNRGNKVLNISLSQARVNAVRDYLVARDVSKYRISGKGFGGSKPIADNSKEETRKLNRRVEFEVQRD